MQRRSPEHRPCCWNGVKYVYAINAATQREHVTYQVSKIHTSENQLHFCSLSIWCDHSGQLATKTSRKALMYNMIEGALFCPLLCHFNRSLHLDSGCLVSKIGIKMSTETFSVLCPQVVQHFVHSYIHACMHSFSNVHWPSTVCASTKPGLGDKTENVWSVYWAHSEEWGNSSVGSCSGVC